ncbi:g11297 [Coccomyxa viridis]|uniref:G11297 protein n=1 Tax=Coccomyxa viridis TaxID=1274662 RepID=A0ABP1G7K2_9CHLO
MPAKYASGGCETKGSCSTYGNGVVVSTGFGWWPFLWSGKRFTDCTATCFWGPNGGAITGTFPNGGFAEAAASTRRKMQQFGGFRGGGGNFHNGGFRDGGGSAAAASSAAAAASTGSSGESYAMALTASS